jgi:DNA adenine methylase
VSGIDAFAVHAQPVVKWAGGKWLLLDHLLKRLPKGRFETYAEPFCGGAAMFFRLWSMKPRPFARAILVDSNADLIALYRAIQSDVEALIERLTRYQEEYDQRDLFGKSEQFYEVREDTASRTDVERGARLLFLNKTCFNGLWRVNSKGLFNVPFGKRAKPRIVDAPLLRRAHEALSVATLVHGDFTDALRELTKNDFAYFDPPYVPLSKTANFTAYSGKFGEEEQASLAAEMARLHKRGVRAMLSNASTPETVALYKSHAFHVGTIQALRVINSDPNKRGAVEELVVTTYGPKGETTRVVPKRPARLRSRRDE